MTLSNVFIKWEVKKTSLKFAGIPLETPLCTGITNSSFSISGSFPSSRNFLNIISRPSTRLCLHLFRRIAGTHSPTNPAQPHVNSTNYAVFYCFNSLALVFYYYFQSVIFQWQKLENTMEKLMEKLSQFYRFLSYNIYNINIILI